MNNKIKLLQNTSIETIFNGSLQPVLDQIENEVSSVIPDTSTQKGRDNIKSLAFKVTRSKTTIDKQGKILVDAINDEMQAFTDKKKLINDSRKESNLFLKNLAEKVRLPLTEYEEQKAIQVVKDLMTSKMDEANSDNELFDQLIELAKREAELAEKERFQQVESDRIERDNQIREEQKAKLELAKLEAIESEKRAIQAEKDKAQSIRLAKIAEDKRIIDAEKINEINAENARVAQEKAVKAEGDRLDQVKKDRDAKALADIEHVKKVNNDAMSCLVLEHFSVADAKKIVILIAKNKIARVKIEY